MKILNKIIIAFILIGLCIVIQAQQNELPKCSLKIEKGKIIKENNQTFWIIPTTLTNSSNDTLKYFSMSCSWQKFYYVNNPNLHINGGDNCDKNVSVCLTLAPKQSRTVEIKLSINPEIVSTKVSFQIGMNIIDANNMDKAYKVFRSNKKENIIWSNSIEM